jgi:hypothetical protein
MRNFRRAISMARISFIFKPVPPVLPLILRSTFRLVLGFRIPICLKKVEYNSIPVDSFPSFWFVSLLSISLESLPTYRSGSPNFLRTYHLDGAATRAPFELYR